MPDGLPCYDTIIRKKADHVKAFSVRHFLNETRQTPASLSTQLIAKADSKC